MSRDRGPRAILEASGAVAVLFALSWRLGPILASGSLFAAVISSACSWQSSLHCLGDWGPSSPVRRCYKIEIYMYILSWGDILTWGEEGVGFDCIPTTCFDFHFDLQRLVCHIGFRAAASEIGCWACSCNCEISIRGGISCFGSVRCNRRALGLGLQL